MRKTSKYIAFQTVKPYFLKLYHIRNTEKVIIVSKFFENFRTWIFENLWENHLAKPDLLLWREMVNSCRQEGETFLSEASPLRQSITSVGATHRMSVGLWLNYLRIADVARTCLTAIRVHDTPVCVLANSRDFLRWIIIMKQCGIRLNTILLMELFADQYFFETGIQN